MTTIEKKELLFPSHSSFCKLVEAFRPGKPPLSKWMSWPLYVVAFFGIWLVVAILGMSGPTESSKYPRDKYRRVVKEGILWDSVEWHER